MNQSKQLGVRIKAAFLMLTFSFLLGGCASIQASPEQSQAQTYSNGDPFESVNRSIYQFNFKLDRWALKPVAGFYQKYIPKPVRHGVRNFFSNLWEPNTIINTLLQGKPKQAVDATTRFLLNSTIGILGVFDVATPFGVAEHEEDFGQTLAVWGVGDGPYLMLPFFGPSNLRDTGGLILQYTLTDLVPPIFDANEQLIASGMRVIDSREAFLGADETLQLQVDPYLFLRETYRQSRAIEIADGVTPDVEEDPFEAELFDDE